MNDPKDFKNRIFDLTGFAYGTPNEKCIKLIKLLDSGLDPEKEKLKELDTHWIIFLFECSGHVYGTLLVDDKTSPSIVANLREEIGKYLKRLFPSTSESTSAYVNQCINQVEKIFPSILQKNILGCVFQFD